MSRQASPPRVLIITNAYPTDANPTVGLYVRDHVESLRELGVPVDLLHVDRLAEGRVAYRRLSRRVRERIRATDPDLVHVMYGGVMAEIVSRTLGLTPLLVSFQGTDLLGGRERSLVTRVRRRYGVLASRRAASRAAGITVQARVLADALPPQVDRGRVWIVPGGVDLARFAPRDRDESRSRLGWSPDAKHIAFPWSRRRVEKRYSLARAAVSGLRSRGIDAELHTFEGVAHEEVPLWLNASDAVLVTSTHEGSSNAVKEALACNVPVVSVDVGDARERLDGLTASSVVPPTAADLASALEQAFAHQRLDEGRRRVQDLALPRVAAQVARIYETLVRQIPNEIPNRHV